MAGGLQDRTEGERISRLFADITHELERAHEVSVDGQDGHRSNADRRRLLARLSRRLDRCAAIVVELSVLLEQ